jgi:hypothetical protein
MRLPPILSTPLLLVALLCAIPAHSEEHLYDIGRIAAPAAKSAGRLVATENLRKLGKDDLQQAKERANSDCADYHFSAKVLLDTPVLFSLDVSRYWTCDGRATQSDRTALLFDMTTGKQYDVARLYHVREKDGALVAPLRRLIGKRMELKNKTASFVAMDVDEDLSKGPPSLFVRKKGISAWPAEAKAWAYEADLTWKDLRPYLDKAEAKRLGWDPQ